MDGKGKGDEGMIRITFYLFILTPVRPRAAGPSSAMYKGNRAKQAG